MKTLLKILGTILLFCLMYGIVMLGVYHYLYPYPEGYLDVVERAAEARNFVIVYKTDLDKDTMLYFSRSNNGVGNQVHVGTIDSKVPHIIGNFYCTETSSVYFPTNAYGYVKADDEEGTCYLYGATTDENTVKVTISFYLYETKEYVDIDMIYDNQVFYFVGFDETLGPYESRIYGFNEDDGITFEYAGEGLTSGGFISKDGKGY
ncbi:MAG: hypothetical protein IJI05_01580 [Erysipelotrichaceae bacterium]|nr:hypothetical protein [Erysipelotrichaceae bacterium]